MTFLLWLVTNLVRWVRLKIYQYEVTFAVYMLTPTEKFIFSTSSCVPPKRFMLKELCPHPPDMAR